MKNLFKFVFVAAAAMALSFCSKDEPVNPGQVSGLRINITSSSTRTVFEEGNVRWSGNEEMALFINGTRNNGDALADVLESGQASFMFLTNITEPGSLKLQGAVPAASVLGVKISDKTNDNAGVLQMELKSAQAATAASFDPAADILVSKDCDCEVTQEDVDTGIVNAEFYFGRVMAITRYAVANSRADVSDDEVVESVMLSLNVGEDNAKKGLTGRFYFDISKGCFVDNSGERVDAAQNPFYSNQSFPYVSIEYPEDARPTLGELNIWTVTAPVTLEAGDQLVFTIKTDRNTIVKTSTLKAPISLVSTALNTSTVKIVDNDTCVVTPVEKPADDVKTATLTQEEIQSIFTSAAYKDFSYDNSFGTWSGKAYTGKSGSTYYLQINTDGSNNASGSHILTPEFPGYIVSVELELQQSSSRAVYLSTEKSTSSGVVATDDSGSRMNILFNNIEGEYSQLYIVGGTAAVKQITVLYKESTDPKISVAEADKVQNIPAAGDVVTVPFSAANLTGEVTASCDAEWVSEIEVSDGEVTFMVDANDQTSERTAVLTIKSEADGVSATVEVKQAGDTPVEPTKLATPEVTATSTATSVTLTWEAVDNADKYEYTIGDNETGTTAETTVTVDMAAGTYDWTVKAVSDDTANYTASDAATGTVTVEAGSAGDEVSVVFIAADGYELSANGDIYTATDGTVTMKYEKGEGSNYALYNPLRVYGGNTMTFEGANIIKIELTASATNYYGKTLTINEGGGTYNAPTGEAVATWKNAAGSNKVVLQNGKDGTGQIRYSKIVVTYKPGDGGDIPVGPTKLATPEVKATSDATSVTLTWAAVAGADSYEYTIGDDKTGTTAATTVTVDMAAGTYDWTVKAVSSDTANYTASDVATGKVTVSAEGGDDAGWVEVTDFSTVTTGKYIYVTIRGDVNYCMSNAQANVKGVKPIIMTSLPDAAGFVAGSDMVLTFTGNQADGFTISNEDGDYLGASTSNDGVSMKDTNSSTKWVINANSSCNFTIKQITPNANRYLGLYTTSNYRSYTSENTNIVKDTTYKLYRYNE